MIEVAIIGAAAGAVAGAAVPLLHCWMAPWLGERAARRERERAERT